MLDTVHVLTGVVIGKYIQNPIWAFILGIISHYVLDWLPHWDGEQNEQLSGAKYHTDKREQSKRKGLTRSGKQLLYYDMAATVLIFLFFTAMGAVPKFWDIPAVLVFAQAHTSIVAGFFGALFPDILLLLYLLFGWQKSKWLFLPARPDTSFLTRIWFYAKKYAGCAWCWFVCIGCGGMLEFHKNIQTRHMKKIPGLIMQAIISIGLIVLFLI